MSATIGHIDGSKAIEIAIRFLQQHHSISGIKRSVLDNNGFWTIEAVVSSYDTHQTKRIRVDSKTGRIVEYW